MLSLLPFLETDFHWEKPILVLRNHWVGPPQEESVLLRRLDYVML